MFFKNKIATNFIIAAPRSGTTWMSNILNAHPQINCVERRLFGNYADFVKDDGQELPRLRVTLDKYVDSLLQHHGIPVKEKSKVTQTLIEALKKEEYRTSKKPIVVDKITPYLDTSSHVLESIAKYFPNSKIIYLVRDGRDVLTSGVFHWFNKKLITNNLNDFEIKRRQAFINKENFDLERFFQDKEIYQWANEWAQPLQTIEFAKKSHEVKIVFYEDMLQQPFDVVTDCLHFFQAKTNKSILDSCIDKASFKKMSQGREQGEEKANAHVRKGILGDWKNYFTYTDGKLFNDIAGSELLKFGYEENLNWFEALR